MRKRLVIAALSIVAVPLLFSTSQNNKLTSSVPFATVALAGHTILGSWCECGTPGCICDPGELAGSSRPVPNQTEKSLDQTVSPIGSHSRSGDFGTGALMLALALFLWTRLRA
jgi:hypothetical protein